MNQRIKRIIYALVLGAVFAYFTSITDAAAPATADQVELTSRVSSATTTKIPRVSATVAPAVAHRISVQDAKILRLQQRFWLEQQSLRRTFTLVPDGQDRAIAPPFFNTQFVPVTGSLQNGFSANPLQQPRKYGPQTPIHAIRFER